MDSHQSTNDETRDSDDTQKEESIFASLEYPEEKKLESSPGTASMICSVQGTAFKPASSQEKTGSEQMQDSERKILGFCKNCSVPFYDVAIIMPKLLEEFHDIYKPHKKGQKNLFFCALCRETVQRREEKETHMLKHISENDISCEHCTIDRQEPIMKGTSKPRQMKSLSYRKETEKVEFDYNTIFEFSKIVVYCGKCGHSFSRGDILLREFAVEEILTPIEFRSELRVTFICSVCGKEDKNELSLASHIMEHNVKRHFLCVNCQKSEDVLFLCLYKGNVPKLSEKGGETVNLEIPNPVQCTLCQSSIERPDLLTMTMMHVNVGRTFPYICIVCGYEFFTKTDVTNHIQVHISHENKMYCDHCIEKILNR